MMLHIDGSDHAWFQDQRRHELIVVLEDASSEIYYAQLVEAESMRTVLAALREVVESKGLFCSLPDPTARRILYSPHWLSFRVWVSHSRRADFTMPNIDTIGEFKLVTSRALAEEICSDEIDLLIAPAVEHKCKRAQATCLFQVMQGGIESS